MCYVDCLHVAHLHCGPYQLFVSVLNCESVVAVRKCSGREFHIFGASDRKECLPYLVVFTWGMSAVFVYLKEYGFSVVLMRSCR